MIISHRHKFIFIKNRKVGSTSMERALQAICGPEDVLTPDHLHRTEDDVLLPEARNYDGHFNPLRELVTTRRPIDAARVLRDFARRPAFYNHMRASSVKARIPARIWDSYYKFCFERNPWDKVVSFYYWFGRWREMPEFNDFVQNRRNFGTDDQTLPSDWTRYTLHDRIIVDEVFDYADLEGGLRRALRAAGVAPEIVDTVRLGAEKSHLRQRDPIQLEAATDAVIRQAFAREIAQFSFCAAPRAGLFAPTDARMAAL